MSTLTNRLAGSCLNDSIALKKANVSVSLRGATTIATDSAQIVLMDGTLNQRGQMFDLLPDFYVLFQNNRFKTIPSITCITPTKLPPNCHQAATKLPPNQPSAS